MLSKLFRRSRAVMDQIAELERPEGDRRKIQRFVDGEDRAFELGLDSARALKRGRVSRYDRLLERGARLDRRAQREVRGFKPRACFSREQGEV